MNILRLLNRSISTTIFVNIIFIVLWLMSTFWFAGEKNDVEISVFNAFTLFSLPYFWSVIAQLFCFVSLAFFVSKFIFSQYFTITTYLPFSVLMLFGTAFQSAHLFGNQLFATLFLVLAIWQFIKIDISRDNSLIVLNTFLLFMASVFFVPEFIYFTTVFIFVFFCFIEIKFKTLIIMLFSISMPILCALGVCFLLDRIDLFVIFFYKLFDFKINTQLFEINTMIIALISIIFVLISLFLFWKNIRIYKFQVRRFTLFLVIFWLSTMFFMLLQNNFRYFILTYIILSSFFISLNLTNLQPQKVRKSKPVKRRLKKYKKITNR